MNDLQKKMKRLELEICFDELMLRKEYLAARRRMNAQRIFVFTLLGSLAFGYLLLSKNKMVSKLAKEAGEGAKFLSEIF